MGPISNGEARFIILGSAAAIVGPIVLFASVLAGIVLQVSGGSEYYCLSDLGVSRVPYVPYLFNIPLVITGMVVLVFAIAMAKVLQKGKLPFAGMITMIASGVFTSLIGIFTEAESTRQLHILVSTGPFALFPISITLIGISLVKRGMRGIGYVSIVTPIITLPAAFLVGQSFPAHSCAVGESVLALGLYGWLMWMGRNLKSQSKRPAGFASLKSETTSNQEASNLLPAHLSKPGEAGCCTSCR